MREKKNTKSAFNSNKKYIYVLYIIKCYDIKQESLMFKKTSPCNQLNLFTNVGSLY